MSELKAVVALYQDLSKEWSKAERRDLDKIGKLLEQLKLNLTMLSFMPSKGEDATIQVKYTCTTNHTYLQKDRQSAT